MSLSTPQLRIQLERANFVRIGLSQVKEELGRGRLTLAEALADPRAQRLRVADLLKSVRGVGPVKVVKICARVDVKPHHRVEALSSARRRQLVNAAAGRPALDLTDLEERALREVTRAPGGVAAVAYALGADAVNVRPAFERLEQLRLVRDVGRPMCPGLPLYAVTGAGVVQLGMAE